MSVILIRHGRVDKTAGLPLSSQGLSFAKGLSGTFSSNNIRKIMASSAAHLQATVEPLAQSLGISITNYSSAADIRAAISQGDWSISDIVIVFRVANAREVFNACGVGGSAPGSSDEAYGNIWFVNPENRTVSTSPTGF